MSSVLAVHDGRAGNARQALALAAALGGTATEACTLQPHAPWRWLAPRRLPGAAQAFGHPFTAALRTRPGIAVGCGRQAALATRVLRGGGARAVQILDPRLDPHHWDLVVTPLHDGLAGDNVMTVQGSLHPVDDAWLAAQRTGWPALASLPAPRRLLLVGGPTRHAPIADAAFGDLLRQLATLAQREGGSLSVVASRRTPPTWRAAIDAIDSTIPGVRWRDARDGANPYGGLLAQADALVATPDSVNMLSEAAATLAPLYVAAPQAAVGRIGTFVAALMASGRARGFATDLAPYPTEPLRETARVAAEIRRRFGMPAPD